MRVLPRLLVSLFLLPLCGRSAPVFEGIPVTGSANVNPTIPVAKALVLPVSVYDDAASASQPTITATSSNPNIMVRVKTGNPLLKMHITHSSPDIDSDVVFQLFDDLAPQTTAYIEGFAQAGYYDGLLFHRIADLSGGGAGTPTEFIFQGGDPLGSNPAKAGQGGPGFTFDNELSAPLIFAGRGQLAMANSGASSTGNGTNGSQFFFTNSPVRELDFGYTIFGQMTHGWSVLPKLAATPRSTGTDSSGNDITDRPTTPVTLTSASVVTQYTGPDPTGAATHTYTDAVLILTAVRPGTATITVQCGATTATFTATAQIDTTNDHPFFLPISDLMTKAERINVPFHAVDLEYDAVDVGAQLANDSATSTNDSKATIGSATTPNTLLLIGTPRFQDTATATPGPYAGPLFPILNGTQWYPGFRNGYDTPHSSPETFEAPNVAIGTPPVTDVPVVLTGAPGVALTNAVVARFEDSDRLGQPGNYTASINWGDGKTVSAAGTIAFGSAPGGYHQLTVTGTNTYAKAGIYPLVVTITGGNGWTKDLHGTAIITASPLIAAPAVVDVGMAAINSRAVATFTDSTQPGAAAAYTATVDWGDGVLSPGVVRLTSPGHYTVYGTHLYRDPEIFPFLVRVHKAGADASTDAIAWSRLRVSGFSAPPHLPPFSQAHVSGELTPLVLFFTSSGTPFYETLKETVGNVTKSSQTYLTAQLKIKNGGNLASRASTLRLWLARGTTIQKTPSRDSTGKVVTPADVPLAFGPNVVNPTTQVSTPQTSVGVRALAPGQQITYYFEQSALGDERLRLPANETGTGYNVIAELDYGGSAITSYEPVSLPILGRIQGINVSPTSVTTSETGSSGIFTVALDRKPTANVTIALTGDSTEGTLSTSLLTFTPANWFSPQAVTVTGVSDSGPNADHSDTTYTVTLGAAQSADPLYQGLIPPTVSVTNKDRDSNILVGAIAGELDAGAVVSSAPTLATTAPNGTGTITLSINKKPSASVSVQVTVGNTANGEIVQEGTTNPGSTTVTFDPSEFTSATALVKKNLFLHALTDPNNAGKAVSYTVTFVATSADPNFSGITPVPVTVTNTNP